MNVEINMYYKLLWSLRRKWMWYNKNINWKSVKTSLKKIIFILRWHENDGNLEPSRNRNEIVFGATAKQKNTIVARMWYPKEHCTSRVRQWQTLVVSNKESDFYSRCAWND